MADQNLDKPRGGAAQGKRTGAEQTRIAVALVVGALLAVFAVLNACGHNIRKILAHLRAWLAWIIAVLWAAKTMPNSRHLTADAA